MAAIDRRNQLTKRCVILSHGGQWSELIAKALSERGVESLRSEDLSQSDMVTEELLRQLERADFVVASLPNEVAPNLAFELGVAVAWRKPTLVFNANHDRLLDGVHSICTVRTSPGAGGYDIGPDIDRFIRHAEKAHVTRPKSEGRSPQVGIGWAQEQLTVLAQTPPEGRDAAFEQLTRQIFKAAGMQVVDIQPRDRAGADLIVWQNDVAYELGGPILIECKYTLGRSERADSAAIMRRAVEKMEKYIRESDAELGLLVVGSSQQNASLRKFDTPRVLTFKATELIDVIERGSLADEVMQRRQRAATELGALVSAD